MKVSELKDLSKQELAARGRELRKGLFNVRQQAVVGRLEKPSEIRRIRKDIARVETVLSQKKDLK